MNERRRILVVDDKENMRRLLTTILGDQHEVTVAGDGEAALSLLERERFDVVLTDVRMPRADGLQVLRWVKERWPETVVVVMTAYASIGAAVEAIKLGAFDYIQKPFDPDDVVLVVARALEAREAPEAPAGARGESVESLSYRDAVNRARDQASRDYLVTLLKACSGNVTRAAHQAGLERESVHRLLKRYGLRAESYRGADDRDGEEERKTAGPGQK